MCGHLLDEEYDMLVFNRTKEKTDNLVKQGAEWRDSPAEIAREADIIFTIVGYPKDVEEVYLGENGIIANARQGSIIIDMTTSDPELAEQIYARAKEKGIQALDAPVTGGDIGAKEAKLVIMVGGDKDAYEKVHPLFGCMGRTVQLMGKAGTGQHTKLANQISIGASLLGTVESILYAKRMGIDPELMLKTISGGSAGSWQMNNMGPRIIKSDFEPGFFIKHFIKDLRLALKESEKKQLDLPILKKTIEKYEEAMKQDMGELGTQAIYKLLDR